MGGMKIRHLIFFYFDALKKTILVLFIKEAEWSTNLPQKSAKISRYDYFSYQKFHIFPLFYKEFSF